MGRGDEPMDATTEAEVRRAMKFLRSGKPMPLLNFIEQASCTKMGKEERRIVASFIMGVDIMEVFSPERINQVAAKFGLIAGSSLDLMTGWDLSGRNQQKKVWELIEKDEPEVIVGSPPCTMFAMLQNINRARHSWNSEWKEKFEKELAKAKDHVAFCCRLHRHQMARGRYFLHEHRDLNLLPPFAICNTRNPSSMSACIRVLVVHDIDTVPCVKHAITGCSFHFGLRLLPMPQSVFNNKFREGFRFINDRSPIRARPHGLALLMPHNSTCGTAMVCW